MNAGAIIVAAGTGERLRREFKQRDDRRHLVFKPFLPLAGKPLLWYSLNAFEKSPPIKEIVLVTHASRLRECRERLLPRYGFRKVKAVVAGGRTRQASVAEGLRALSPGIKTVLVHDAARPFVGGGMIAAVLRCAARGMGAVPGLPAAQTIKRADKRGFVLRTLPREGLWEIQTPQAFPRRMLQAAHEAAAKAGATGTDDASLAERLGKRVKVLLGTPENFKVTHAEDFRRAEGLLAAQRRIRA